MTRHLQLICATANPHKLVEIQAILDEAGAQHGLVIELLPRPAHLGEVIEDADTLEGNALLKADAVAAASGMPAVADDTGLEVSALGGAPGVYSARYAGEDATYADNCRKLLAELAATGSTDRSAVFATVAVVRWPAGGPNGGAGIVARGECRGRVTATEQGERGFGYDPVFAPDEDRQGRTFSQMSEHEKNAISHRGRAFRLLVELLARS